MGRSSPALRVSVCMLLPLALAAQFIQPELAQHTSLFQKQIHLVSSNVYSAVGYSLGNSILIEGDSGGGHR